MKCSPILSKLPLDHFTLPPSSDELKLFEKEVAYARKIMSFSRPARDRYYNFVHEQIDPLRNFEITDLGTIREVVLPGLRRPATFQDVSNGLARRETLPVDFSKALFVRIIPQTSRLAYEESFGRWEKAFAFLLNHGVACVLLSPKDPKELATQLSYLQANHSNFAENIFAFAEGEAVGLLNDALNNNDEIMLRCLIVKDPADEIIFNEKPSPMWFMGISSEDAKSSKVIQSMINRAHLNRGSNFVYHSRLSGLIYQESESENLSFSSFPMAYILNCLEFYRYVKFSEPESMNTVENNSFSLLEDYTLSDQEIPELSSLSIDDLNYTYPEPNFDCEVVREYRNLNKDDASVADLTNRELVLQLGSSFEEIGVEVLEQIANQDPIFYRFYLSLKEIEISQN